MQKNKTILQIGRHCFYVWWHFKEINAEEGPIMEEGSQEDVFLAKQWDFAYLRSLMFG